MILGLSTVWMRSVLQTFRRYMLPPYSGFNTRPRSRSYADRTSSCESHAVSVSLPVADNATAVPLRLIDLQGDLAVRDGSLTVWTDAAVTGRQLFAVAVTAVFSGSPEPSRYSDYRRSTPGRGNRPFTAPQRPALWAPSSGYRSLLPWELSTPVVLQSRLYAVVPDGNGTSISRSSSQ